MIFSESFGKSVLVIYRLGKSVLVNLSFGKKCPGTDIFLTPAGKIPFAAFSFIRCNANLMRMIAALAFVLPDDGESAFYALSDIMPEEGTDTLNYFEDTYIGRQIRRTRRAPLFTSIYMYRSSKKLFSQNLPPLE